jgi:biopolymer transport protein ExbB
MDLTDKFLQFALLGANWVLWVLVLMSVASVAIMVERWLFYRGFHGRDPGLAKPLADALGDGAIDQARGLVTGGTSPGARMVFAMLDARRRTHDALAARLAAARPAEQIRLERNLAFLGTVGANAPFIGLFGTVLEILRVFHLLGEQGVQTGEEAKEIMSGISEALVATAIGLLVAIPAAIVYNAFQRKVKRLMGEADALANMSLAQLAGTSAEKDD